MNWNWKSAFLHLKFIKKKPLVSFKIAKGFFKKLVLRQDILRTVGLAVTYDCHYNCQYCSAYLLKRKGKPILSPDQIKDIWQQADELGAIHINLTGGEPLMRNIDELCLIIRSLAPKRTLISLVTNSLLVTKEKLLELKKAGLDTLQLSIESIDPEINDSLRGSKGAFIKTMEAFKYAKELGLNICLSCVICHNNKQEIEKLLDFARKENVFLLLNIASSVGKWQDRADKKMVEKDIAVFEEFIKDKYIRNDTSFNFSGKRECPGGKERIYITAYGDVMTCPLVQVSYGNVLKEPLKDIYSRMASMPHLKKYSRLCKQAFDKDYYENICQPAEQIPNPPLSIFKHPISKSKKPKKLSVIIPCYNEEKTITEIIKRVAEIKLNPIAKEIIVVDDGSTDNTALKLAELKDGFNFQLLTHKENLGKCQAIRTGLEFATGDYVIFQDADLEYDPKDYRKILETAVKKNAKVVYGSRQLNPEVGHLYLSFYLGGLFLTKLANFLYGLKITDEATCYKLFETKILKDLKLNCRGFEFCPEVTAKIAKKGIKIYEVPINYKARSKSEGKKIKWRDGFMAAWILIKYKFID